MGEVAGHAAAGNKGCTGRQMLYKEKQLMSAVHALVGYKGETSEGGRAGVGTRGSGGGKATSKPATRLTRAAGSSACQAAALRQQLSGQQHPAQQLLCTSCLSAARRFSPASCELSRSSTSPRLANLRAWALP